MAKDHVPIIRRPTDEELDAAIACAEGKGWWGLVGALLDYKQLRQKEAQLYGKANDRISPMVSA
jgi:hypothetical protein